MISSNDEVERRGGAPTANEAALFQSSIPSLAHRRHQPRDRSNRLLADQSVIFRMRADPKPEHAAFNILAECPILVSHSRRP
jgi:hypothetical protein